ncbi:hypothetical protein G7078_05495 [Sphingomonas sinipercae]|uniref:Capsule biosynthesis protein n=1 Tax=Sphingomonas sinipercae TaxID=2714944 RepID=A0A6G7ZN24_9SPHN|nr:DUF6356 family protein [Sphingomonas sinipercae]QIL02296.1 hypothetical protein G7078_05495 [Sphingomonas sinipercae]
MAGQKGESDGVAWKRLFTDHPASLGMSWFGHGVGALKIGVTLIGAGLACLVHAIVPALFTQTAGKTVSEIYDHMMRRKAGAANPNDWPDYEI